MVKKRILHPFQAVSREQDESISVPKLTETCDINTMTHSLLLKVSP